MIVQVEKSSVLVLAGGSSTRFKETTGINKIFYEIHGQTMIEHIVDLAKQVSSHVMVSVNDEDRKHQIQQVLENVEVEFVVDRQDLSGIQGPLNGILSALPHCREQLLLLPVDYPHLTLGVLRALLKEFQVHQPQISVFASPRGQVHNLVAVLDRSLLARLSEYFHFLTKSRVSSLLRMAERISILQYKTNNPIFTNMNQMQQVQIDDPTFSYSVETVETENLFQQYLRLRQKDNSRENLRQLLQKELEHWGQFSVSYHIKRDLREMT